jgi:thiamine pyrophosphate-dependent acetolactate synthase large subunit-like protein
VNATSAVTAVVRAVPDALMVSSLGTATSALRAATGDGPHLYLGGAMGSALATAVGVAEKRPERRVVAVVGDGELLMGASSLWTVAGARPPRLTVAVLSDGHYSITGGQPLGVPSAFVEVARALGLDAETAENEEEVTVAVARAKTSALVELRCGERDWPGPSAFVDPPVVRWRFEQAARSG